MSRFFQIFFLSFLLLSGKVFGQLSLEIDPINQVLVGGGFQISGRIVHDANSTDITAGTPILLDIEIQDPSGNPVSTNPTQVISGGFSGGRVENFAQSFQMPWSEDDKWNTAARWRAVVNVSGGGSPSGNITFPLVIPDLSIDSVTTPVTAEPGSFVTLQGTISNPSIVATEAQRFFRIEASIVGSNITESIIFPDPDNFPANSPWPIQANSNLNFSIPNFFIPLASTGTVQVQVTVDPSNPDIIPESNQGNNSLNHNITISTGDPNIAATVFFDSLGTYQGLDPIQLKLVVRNNGSGPIIAGNNFDLTIALSLDNRFSTDDYILREIDFGGSPNSLGLGLLPNETVTVEWVQLLPDNFEGDFYFLVSENQSNVPLFTSETPEITLRSQDTTDVSFINTERTGTSTRPSASDDGKFVVFESNENGFNQIFLYNFITQETELISKGLNVNQVISQVDGNSFAPKISGDGRYVVFHSFATNLVNGDNNRHSDIFLYNIYSKYLRKISNGPNGLDSNGKSFYPSINQDGSRIAFESEATNLVSASTSNPHKQIFIFDHNTSNGNGSLRQITNGNADSFAVDTDDNGTRLVFTSFATDLVVNEIDNNGHSDVIFWDEKSPTDFYFAGRTETGNLPAGGDTKEPVISGNGEIIAFVSSAPNMVTNKGISYIEIVDEGLDYSGEDVVEISDTDGNGTGAKASLLLNEYGAVTQFSIDAPGRNYTNPVVTVNRLNNNLSNTRNVVAIPRLVNPFGDVFQISTNSVFNNGPSSRVSESQKYLGEDGSETGGDERSREPSIDYNGSFIAYSTKSSNLLDLNVTSTSQKVFPNQTFRPAIASARLIGGIGKIIVANPGSGYPSSGILQVQDLSGNGSGAVITYQVDSNGGIGSIDISNPGSGYDLSQTIISVQNPGTGTGFQAGQILFPAVSGTGSNRTGGASIHRVEMVDSGIGYPQSLQSVIQTPIIIVDGDGIDTDGDGRADSRVNPDKIHFGQNGEVYLEQQFEITLNSLTSLSSTTLEITDYLREERGDQPLVFSFDTSQFPTTPLTISTSDNNLSSIRDRLITEINNQWGGNPQDLFEGPQIDDNLTNGFSFTLKALSGRVNSNNPSALGVVQRTNMLIQGSGFSRATAQVLPYPVIHGFSEMEAGQNTFTATNGRPVVQYQDDFFTDDIYLFDQSSLKNKRISVSKFGFPTNYRGNTNMPSHRFPSLTSDGRYVFYSSDAGGENGLIFGNSNQVFDPDNLRRDIFVRDMKSNALFKSDVTISINEEILLETNHVINLNTQYPILVDGSVKNGSFIIVSLYVNGELVSDSPTDQNGSQAFSLFFPWKPERVGSHSIFAELTDNVGNVYTSTPVNIYVTEEKSDISSASLVISPNPPLPMIIIRENDGNGSFVNTNPLTQAEIEQRVNANDIPPGSLAFYAGQNINEAVNFSEVYPFRKLVTNGSSLTSLARFIGRDGKEKTLSKVIFYLNGRKISEQTQPPYSVIFEPPSLHSNGKSISSRWALTALAIDPNNRSFLTTEYGNNLYSELFPVVEIDLVNGITGVNKDQILDGQVVTIDGEINGPSSILTQVNNIYLVANGVLFADSNETSVYDEIRVNRIFTNTGNMKKISFSSLFDVEFEKYAKPNGSIMITAFVDLSPTSTVANSFLPVTKSNSLNLNVAEPMPWLNEQSNLLTLFSDLTFRNPTSEEITYALDHLNEAGNYRLESWIDGLSKVAALSDKIDIVGANKVIYGEWHPEFKDFEEDCLRFSSQTASTPVWLKSYIDENLESNDYRFKYGNVPYLVGDFANSEVTNFLNNRYDFIRRCYLNKYREYPSIQQLYQGSYNMLQFWATFEVDYWELPTSNKGATDVDSPPRRDAIATASNVPPWDSTQAYPPGSEVSLNRFEYVTPFGSPAGEPPPGSPRWILVRIIGFSSGEIATDFIWRFSKEIEFFKGVPYILSTTAIRDTHFKIATLMHLLWRKNADPITDADIDPLSVLPTNEAIAKILSDSRYTSRFNLIWKNSTLVDENLPNWKNESWFGQNFWDKSFPWIYHMDWGWLYIAGVSPTSFWFYSENYGWLWTGSNYYPQFYSSKESSWMYFYGSTDLNNPYVSVPHIYNYNLGTYFPFKSN